MKVRRIIWALPLLCLACSNYEMDYLSTFKEDAIARESSLSASLNIPPHQVQLMGSKTIPIPTEEQKEFSDWFGKMDEFLNNEQVYYAEDGTYFLMYCPLSDAIVLVDGCDTVYADEKGRLQIKREDYNSAVIIGRKKSENILGTGNSKVLGDNIIFDKPLPLVRNTDAVLVYDLGIRNCSAQCSESKKSFLRRLFSKSDPEPHHGCEETKVSCLANHGGVNCSTAFKINKGRCDFNPNVCMDYNGWGTDCVDGKTSNFPGSDCFFSMLQGHCWNEI